MQFPQRILRPLVAKAMVVCFCWFAITTAVAQHPFDPLPDSTAQKVQAMSKTLQVLEKIKLSGYIQMQYQKADTLGVRTFNGGDFPAMSSQRFLLRRCYLKAVYEGKLSSYVLQINVNEKGFTVRDAYFTVKEPWLKAFSVTGGIFFRPFGNELSYSTSLRESPELSRVTQTLFPGERDLGAMLSFKMPKGSPLSILKIDAGLFSGNGITAETDDKLDFIGRIGVADAGKKDKWSYTAGISYYNGHICQTKRDVYGMATINQTDVFSLHTADTIPGTYFKREYIGIDAQVAFNTLLGKTMFRGDFYNGRQPGAEKSTISPSAAVDYPLFLRKFHGAVFYMVQSFAKNKHSIVLRYDCYDPNSEIEGNAIGKSTPGAKATGSADLSYKTWGFGWVTDVNSNLRLVGYFDLVKNEKSTSLSGYNTDSKDNVFTLRVQYKF